MKYQVSLEGHIKGCHAQLDFYDVDSYDGAINEVKERKHLPRDRAEEYIALLFEDIGQAIKDGIPEDKIETLRIGDGPLYRYKARLLK